MRGSVRSKRRHQRIERVGKAVGIALILQHAATGVSAQTIRPDGNTATSVLSRGGGVYDVTTGTQVNANAFNSFSTFGVAAGQTVNLHVPGTAQNLINIVRDARTDIHGVLNAFQDGRIAGNVYFANPHGFVVGAAGIVNVGSLHVTTPTKGFVDSFFLGPGAPNAAAVAQLLAGTAPVGATGLISIEGRINATDGVTLRGGNVAVSGAVIAGAQAAAANVNITDVVNVQGMQSGATMVADASGKIRIVAQNDVAVSGTIAADGAAGRKAGDVNVTAFGNITLSGDGSVSARGRGADSDGGTVMIYAHRDAMLADRARVDVRGGDVSGNGGFAEFSAKETVRLIGGALEAGATRGRAGTIFIDPVTLVISNADTPSSRLSGGGNLIFQADETLTVAAGTLISTRNIGGGGDHDGGLSAGDSGNLTFIAPTISVGSGAQLFAHGNNGFQGGTVTFTAARGNGGTASITMADATVKGAAIVANATSTVTSNAFVIADADAAARIDLNGTRLTAGAGGVTLNAVSTITAATNTAIPVGIVTVDSGASIDVRGTTRITSDGVVTVGAQSNVTANAIVDSPISGNLPGDAAVAVTDITSGASTRLYGSAVVDAAGAVTFTADNSVTAVATADAAAAGSTSAGATVAVAKIRSTTLAAVDEAAEIVRSRSVGVLARSQISATTEAKASAGGASQADKATSKAAETLDTYKDRAKTGDGGVTVAASVAVNDVVSATEARMQASRTATSDGDVTVSSQSTTGSTVAADGSAVSGSVGIAAGVAVNIATVTNAATVAQAITADGLTVEAIMRPAGSTGAFSADAKSGAGASSVGVAGSLAVNVVTQSGIARVAGNPVITLDGGDLVLTAENRATSNASATPLNGGATGSSVGIGASVAVNTSTQTARAELEDSAVVNGAKDVRLDATNAAAVSTLAEAGAAGGIAVTPVAAITVSENRTTARIGTGTLLEATGAVMVSATHTASATTEANADAAGDKVAVGASVAVAVVTDHATATTARSIRAAGDVAFNAHASSASSATAKASAKGGKPDENDGSANDAPDGGVDSEIGKQKNLGGGSGTSAPSASTSSGGVSVAGAIAVNVSDSQATAFVPDGRDITTTGGSLTLSASNNTDAYAVADGSAVGGTAAIGVGAAVAINKATSRNAATLGVGNHSAVGTTVEARMTNVGSDRTSTFGAEATSGAGGAKIGIAGSLALNIVDHTSTATLNATTELDAGGGAVVVAADSASDSTAKALPVGGGATGAQVGIGASFAANIITNRAIAEVADGATLDAADTVTLSASGQHVTTTAAEAGAAGAIAVTPVIALAVVDNQTRARLGTAGAPLLTTGDVVVSASHRSATHTSASADAAGAKVAVGASIAITIVNDTAEATTARDITSGGGVSFAAHSAAASSAIAKASASGGKEDDPEGGADQPDNGVDQEIGAQSQYGKDRQAAGSANASQQPKSASTSAGGISVAAAIGVNVADSQATAIVPDSVRITANGGELKLSASNNTDAAAGADGSAVGKGFNATTGQGSKLGVGAGVAINVVTSNAEARLGNNEHKGRGITVEAVMTDDGTDTTSTTAAEAKAGAGSAKVSVAGALGLNVVDARSSATIASGARVDADGGDVVILSENRTDATAKALPSVGAGGPADVGIGASVALNIATNRSESLLGTNATLANAGAVTLDATGEHRMVTEAEAGSAGRISVTPVVAVSVADNTTEARLGAGSTLLTSGAVLIAARHSGDTLTTAKADAAGPKAAIGASIAITVATDTATATTDRDVTTTGGGVEFRAESSSASRAAAKASAAGGKEDDPDGGADQPDNGVDQEMGTQRDFAQGQQSGSGSGAASNPRAATQQGGISVAAAIGVNVAKSEARAFTPDGIAIDAAGELKLSASNNTDASAGADGSGVGRGFNATSGQGSKLGVGAGVALNISESVAEARLGRATHAADGVTLSATMTDVGGDTTSTTGADASSGAGSAKVGIAGSLAINVASNTSTAAITENAIVFARGGNVSLTSESRAASDVKAVPSTNGGVTGADVGIGASIGVNVVSNKSTAAVENGVAVNTANDLTLAATGEHAMTTEAEAGAAGRISVTPVVAVSVATNNTAATLGTGAPLDIGGNLSLSATGKGSTLTTAKADAAGPKAAIGASIAVTVAEDTAIATTSRSVVAEGGASFTASNIAASSAVAKASATGGTEDDPDAGADQPDNGVDQQTDSQRQFAQDQQAGSGGSTAANPRAATAQGGVSVAAAIGVNVANSEARAFTPDGVSITAKGGELKLSASNNTDAVAGADGTAVGRNIPPTAGGTKVGVGAGVALNFVDNVAEARLGVASHKGQGVTLEAMQTVDGPDDTSTFGADAVSGVGSAKVGIAGSLAINIVDNRHAATIATGSVVDASGGDVSLATETRTASTVTATPSYDPSRPNDVGVGAAVGVNVVTNVSRASIADGADVNSARNVTLSASGDHTTLTTAAAGSAGRISVTPVVGVSVANNTTEALVGSGGALNLTGDLALTATHRGSTETYANADAAGPKAAIGASIAVNVANDRATATTSRDIVTGNGASFIASAVTNAKAGAKASATGGAEDETESASGGDGVDQQIDQQKTYGENKQQGEGAGLTSTDPKAQTSQGGVSVAAAIGVNVSKSRARAFTPDGVTITANGGEIRLSASNNADASAEADGSAVGRNIPPAAGGTKIGVGAGVGINVSEGVAEATLGVANHTSVGATIEAKQTVDGTDDRSTTGAKAVSGAGSAKVGIAGSLALNIAENRHIAQIASGASLDATSGDVVIAAESRSAADVAATPAFDPSKPNDVGIGASFGINVVSNVARAQIASGATLTNANDVTLTASGDHAMTTLAEAGAAGRIAVTPVVAVSVASNTTEALLGTAGAPLTLGGNLVLRADHVASTSSEAKAEAAGVKAAIGASVAVNVSNDKSRATTNRDVVADGGASFTATSAAASSAMAKASARGGTEDESGDPQGGDGVDQEMSKQKTFAEGQQVGEAAGQSAQNPKAATSQGGVSVAAAISVNVANVEARAFTPDGVAITANGGPIALHASTNTDASAVADGAATGRDIPPEAGGTKVGVGAGVAINVAKSRGEARLGNAAHRGAGIDVTADMTDVSGDETSTFRAEATSGAGSAKIGVAGSLALNVIDHRSTAIIATGADVDAAGGAVNIGATSRSDITAIAAPGQSGGASGTDVGVGASIAINVVANSARAELASGAKLAGADTLTVTAVGDHTLTTQAEAGATGNVAVTPVVALAISNNETIARLGGGDPITTAGDVLISASHTSVSNTEAKGSTQGAKAAIGAAIAINVLNDTVLATSERNITRAGGGVTFLAAADTKANTLAVASSRGGPEAEDESGTPAPADGVDQEATAQQDYGNQVQADNDVGNDNATQPPASSQTLPKAQSSEGGVAVAAAISVNVANTTATATIPANRTVHADGAVTIGTTLAADASARSDATVVGLNVIDQAGGAAGGNTGGASGGQTKLGVGAAVAVNVANARGEASIGNNADVRGDGVGVTSTASATSDYVAESKAGAGSAKVSIAGSLALNIIEHETVASIGTGAIVDARGAGAASGGGDVALVAQSATAYSAKALPGDSGGAAGQKVGIGASVAVNTVNDYTSARAHAGSTIVNADAVAVNATSDTDTSVEAKAGAKGGVALDAVVALTVMNTTTEAVLGGGGTMTTGGNVSVTAVNTGTHDATATGDTVSGNVGVGASAAVITSNTSTVALLDRDVDAGGTVTVGASAQRTFVGLSSASAKGAVMDAAEDNPAQGDKTESVKTLKENQQAQQGTSGGGKVNVAAAVAVAVMNDDVSAGIGANRIVAADGAVAVTASNQSDARTRATGEAIDPTTAVGIGVAVALTIGENDTTATIGSGAQVRTPGDVTVRASLAQNTSSGFASQLTADAVSGAGGDKVGVAGSLAVAYSDTSTTASMASDAIVRGANVGERAGAVRIEAENTSKLSAKARAVAAAGKVGVGASVATVYSDNAYAALLGANASVTSGSLSMLARNNKITGTVPPTLSLNLEDFKTVTDQSLQFLLGINNYYTEAIAGSAGGKVAVSGAFSVNIFKDVAEARAATGAQIDASGNVSLTASNDTTAKAFGGAVAGAGQVGVGLTAAAVSNTSTTTASLDAGADVVQAGNLALSATTRQDVGVFGVSAAVAGTAAVGGVATVIDSQTTTQALMGGVGSSITSNGTANAAALADVKLLNVAGNAAGGGTVGVGATGAVNVVKNTTTAAIGNDAAVNAQSTGITATAVEDIKTIVASGAGGGTVGIAASAVVTTLDNTTLARIGDRAQINAAVPLGTRSVNVAASDTLSLFSIVGTAGVGGSTGVGAGADVGVLEKSTRAEIGAGARVNTGGNLTLTATGSDDIRSMAVGFGGGADVGVAGTAVAYLVDEVTAATVGNGATLRADGSILIDANNATEVSVLGGGAAFGGYAGVGATAAVVVIDKDTTASIGSNAIVDALGNGAGVNAATGSYLVSYDVWGSRQGDAKAPTTNNSGSDSQALTRDRNASRQRATLNGLAVTATSQDTVRNVAVTGAGSAIAGIALAGTVATISNDTAASVGDNAQVNRTVGLTPGGAQSVRIAAGTDTFRMGAAGAAGVAGAVGAGAGVDVTIIQNNTTATTGTGAQVSAARHVDVLATGNEEVLTIAVGIAGSGGVALAGSAGVILIDNTTQASLGASSATSAGGNVRVRAVDDTEIDVVAGGLAIGIGAAGIGGAVGVTNIEKDTLATVGNGASVTALATGPVGDTITAFTGEAVSETQAIRGLAVQAQSSEDIFAVSAAGAAGTYLGAAGAVTFQSVKSNTLASIGNDASINAVNTGANNAQDVHVGARNDLRINVIGGSLAGGAVGMAGGVDVGLINSRTGAVIGDRATVNARRDVDVNALAVKDIDSAVVSASGGIGAIAASISVYSVGSPLDGESRGRLSGSGGETADGYANSQASDGSVNTLMQGSSNADQKSISSRAQAKRSAVNVGNLTGTLPSGNTASIGQNGSVTAGRHIDVDARERATLDMINGSVAVGAVSLAAGINVGTTALNNQALIGTGTALSAGSVFTGGDVMVTARLDNTVKGAGLAGAAAVGILAADAAISILTDRSSTVAAVTGNVTRADAVDIDAEDARTLVATADGASVAAGFAAAGASVATVSVGGSTAASFTGRIGQTVGQNVNSLSIDADSNATAKADTLAAKGGIGVAASGSVATATVDPTVAAAIGDGSLITTQDNVSVDATARVRADADAKGFNVAGGVGIGASAAVATADPTITARVGNLLPGATGVSITADNVFVTASQLVPTFTTISMLGQTLGLAGATAQGRAIGAAGGILAGVNATYGEANNWGDVAASIGRSATLRVSGETRIGTDNDTRQHADVAGVNAGILAVGANIGKARSATTSRATLGDNADLLGGTLTVTADGTDFNTGKSQAGSGGVLSGNASSIDTVTTNTTAALIGSGTDARTIDVGAVRLAATHEARFNGEVDSINAALVGVSGASAEHQVTANVDAGIAAGARIGARSYDIDAVNRVRKDWLGANNPDTAEWNIKSGSGGVIDAPAGKSISQVRLNTGVTIGAGAQLVVDEPLAGAADGVMRIDALNDIVARDKVRLDSGGLIAVAKATSIVDVQQANAAIGIGDNAQIISHSGDILAGARTVADLDARASADAYGAAGAPSGIGVAAINANSTLNVSAGAMVRAADGNIALAAGESSDGLPSVLMTTGRVNLWNKTAFPISTAPDAQANVISNATLTLNGALESLADITIAASRGGIQTDAKGIGKDVYRETAGEVASGVSNLFGGGDVSFDVRGESTLNVGAGNVVVNGTALAGIKRNATLILDYALDPVQVPGQSIRWGLVETTKDGISYRTPVPNIEIAKSIRDRIQRLRELQARYAGDNIATAAYGAEIAFLERKLIDLGLSGRDANGNIAAGQLAAPSPRQAAVTQISLNERQINATDALRDTAAASKTTKEATVVTNSNRITTLNNELSPFYTTRQGLQSALDAERAKQNPNQGTITSLTNQINALNASQITPRETERATLQTQNTTLQNEITTLAGQITTYETRINDLTAQNTALTNSLPTLSTSNPNGPTAPFVYLDPVNVRLGNIRVRGDNLLGTGAIAAPGDARIDITNNTPAYLVVGDLTIGSDDGGRVTLNNYMVKNAADINAINKLRTGGNALTLTTRDSTNATPQINITSNYDPLNPRFANLPNPAPDIQLVGEISNLRGGVTIRSEAGSINVTETANIRAGTVDILAKNGDFVQSFVDNFFHVGGDPGSIYANPALVPKGIVANGTVYIAARWLNINGLIQSGIEAWNLNLPTAPTLTGSPQVLGVVGSLLPPLKQDYQNKKALGQNPSRFYTVQNDRGQNVTYDAELDRLQVDVAWAIADAQSAQGRARNPSGLYGLVNDYGNIGSNYQVLLDSGNTFAGDRFVVNGTEVKGGLIQLFGQVMNTGRVTSNGVLENAGKLKVLDGYGTINITNPTGRDVVLNRLDTGRGVAGMIDIADVKPAATAGAAPTIVRTQITRENNVIRTRNKSGTVMPEFTATDSWSGGTNGRTTRYDPQSGFRYVWTTGKDQSTVFTYRYEGEQLFGVEAFRFGEVLAQATLTGQYTLREYTLPDGNFLSRDAALGSTPYLATGFTVSNGAETYKPTGSGSDCNWYTVCIAQKYWLEFERTVPTKTITYNSVKADYPIAIEFSGQDTGAINVKSAAGVILNGNIINRAGTTEIRAGAADGANVGVSTANRSIVQQNGEASITSRDVNLSATGSIGAPSVAGLQAKAVELNVGAGKVTATATAGNVVLNQQVGDLRLGQISAGQLVDIATDGSLLRDTVGDPTVRGQRIELTAANGTIGTAARALVIESGTTTNPVELPNRGLKASAASDIRIQNRAWAAGGNPNGDLLIDTVVSGTGDVVLQTPGTMVDNNLVERVDNRTWAELLAFWDNTRLRAGTGTNADKQTEQLDAYRNGVTADYRAYWQTRNRQGNPSVYDAGFAYVASAAERDALTQSFRQQGVADAQIPARIAAFEASRTADYHRLHVAVGGLNGGAFSTAYTFGSTAADQPVLAAKEAEILRGSSWTERELGISITPGLLKTVTDTNPVIKAPNVQGSTVTLLAGNAVGTTNPLAPIDTSADPSTLTDAQKVALASAERSDLVITDSSITVLQRKPINFDASASINVTNPLGNAVTGNVFLASEGDARLGTIRANGETRIKVTGSIVNAGPAGSGFEGNSLVLEAARGGIGFVPAVGTAPAVSAPLRIAVGTTGTFTARAAENIDIEQDGTLNVDTVYSPKDVRLDASGSILDAFPGTELNMNGRNIVLDAGGAIGAAGNGLDLTTDPAGAITATSGTGGIWIDAPLGNATFGAVTSGDAIGINGARDLQFKLAVSGAGPVSIGASRTLALEAPASVTAAVGDVGLVAGTLQMSDGAAVTAMLGRVAIDTAGDAIITGITSGSGAADAVRIVAGGRIVDAGDTRVDVTARTPGLTATLSGAGGVGTATATPAGIVPTPNAIETDIWSLDIASSSGGANVAGVGVLSVRSLNTAGDANLNGATGLQVGTASTGGSFSGTAQTGDASVNTGKASGSFTITAPAGNVQVGTIDASVVNIAALKQIQAQQINVGTSFSLTGDVIDANIVDTTPAGALSGDVVGSRSPATSLQLDVDSPTGVSFDRLWTVDGVVRMLGEGRIDIVSGFVPNRVRVSNPYTRVLVDNAALTLDADSDVQLHSETGWFSMGLWGRNVSSDAFVVRRGQNFSTFTPMGEDRTAVDAGYDALADIAEVPGLRRRPRGAVATTVVQPASPAVSIEGMQDERKR
jgi:filamentous hemagglutinin family protein